MQKKKTNSKLKIFIANVIFYKDGDNLSNPIIPNYLKESFVNYSGDIIIRSYYAIFWPGLPIRAQLGIDKPIKNYCDHVENVITIRWNGDVVPCCYDLASKEILGNILCESLENIWNGKNIIEFRKKINNNNPPDLCKGCNELYEEKYIRKDEILGN